MTDPTRAQRLRAQEREGRLRQFREHYFSTPPNEISDLAAEAMIIVIDQETRVREAISRLGEPETPAPQPKVDKHKAGLYRKFDVRRTDGSDAPRGKHDQCSYFVLDITHDPFAIPALKAYAKACRKELPNLATDLESLIGGNRLMPYRTHMPPGPRSLMQPAESPVSGGTEAAQVAGECSSLSIAALIRRCEVHIAEEQRHVTPDSALIGTLCEAVRMAREYADASPLVRTEPAKELLDRETDLIVETLRPLDPNSWDPNKLFVRAVLERFAASLVGARAPQPNEDQNQDSDTRGGTQAVSEHGDLSQRSTGEA